MAEELDTLMLKIRADTAALASDAADMKAMFIESAEAIAGSLSDTLTKLIAQGKLGLEDWKRLLRDVLTEIAKIGTSMVFSTPTGGSGGNGLAGLLVQAATAFSTGGRTMSAPVTPGRAFMPGAGGTSRPVSISINMAAPESASPQLMQRSAQQVARAVRRAVAEA